MSTWTTDELECIGRSEELDIASDRADGTPGRATAVWVVQVGDDLDLRSSRDFAGRRYHDATANRHRHIRPAVPSAR